MANRHRYIPIAAGLAAVEAIALIGVAQEPAGAHTDRRYATGTETSSNYGTASTRNDQSVTCSGSGEGFVFHDMWQGVQADAGWVEAGTSYCDSGDPAAKYVWAYRSSSGTYYENVLSRNVPLNQDVNWKITNPNGSKWEVYINGSVRATVVGLSDGSFAANTADVGLEVHPNRYNSVVPASTVHKNLDFQATMGGNWTDWSGRDTCHDDRSPAQGAWASSVEWKYSYNAADPGGTSCTT